MVKSGKKPLTAKKKNVVKLERPLRNWNNSSYRQLQRDYIIENSKDVKYTFYDHYLNDDNREYFKKPIGLYDPLGENVNPYTLKPYENFYENDLPRKYTFGPLQGKDYGVFVNDKGEFINVIRFYQKNTLKFQVIFSKGLGDVATRPAINTVSEKRVLKLINTENFQLVK